MRIVSHVGFMLLLIKIHVAVDNRFEYGPRSFGRSTHSTRTFGTFHCPHLATAVNNLISGGRYRSIGWSRTMHRGGGAPPYTTASREA